MRIALKLAYRNLIGAGLRTWLNVIVLSFSFVMIIWAKGLMVGWDNQAKTDMEQWEIGKGQFWHEQYDPYDAFSINNSHAPIPEAFQSEIENKTMVPVLIAQGTLYPQGRMQSVRIKGIPPDQTLLKIPAHKLDTLSDALPAIVGASMAHSSHLNKGDRVILRWRDNKGTFDATEIEIVDIFPTNVPTVDVAQVWINLETMQEKLLLPNEATLFSLANAEENRSSVEAFHYKNRKELTAEIDAMVKTKSKGQSMFYVILMALAMLAIFDTQVLSIFRRQKEIGTYVALGYTRQQVVGLFTVEGAMHAILAAVVAAVYGVPFFIWQAHAGMKLPMDTSEFGMAIAPVMYPIYSISLIISTTLIVLLTTTLVSYWPSRKIARMSPTDALRGKIQ
ncbi:MAG TPA: FtsX-like permease family protein [Prolixibacteraceae bacterium]|nr:FtsX-like permease family protein [Prolixibacteraceae bacterium]